MRDVPRRPAAAVAVLGVLAAAPPLLARGAVARAPRVVTGRVTDGARNPVAGARVIAQVDAVRANTGLPPRTIATLSTRSAVLDEIDRQRRYALIVTGTRWADERRLGRITEARTTWLPDPAQETVGNPNPPTTP